VTGPPYDPAVVPVDPWLDRFRVTLVGILGTAVAGIAALAFYTSFEAIRAFAVRSDGISPEHAWAIPLLVDSFIVVATAADLWFVITRKRRAWWEVVWPKLLLASAATVSFVLNIAHAEPTLAARGVAAIPPAALVLGVELLMMVLRRATSLRAARVELAGEAAYAEGLARPPAAVGSLTRWRPAQVQAPVPAPSDGDFMLDSPAVPELTPAPVPDDEPASQPDGAGPGVFANAPAPASTLPRRKIDDAVVRRSAYRILFERAPGEVRTAAALRAALADKGIAVDEAAAGRLLREFDAPGERRAGEATAAAELLTALTNHGITVNLRTARRLLREFDAPGARKPGEARTPEELQMALANHGITVNLRTATHLVREFDLPRGDRRWKVAGRAD
jgi:Protein of unknown function (DUF2637)